MTLERVGTPKKVFSQAKPAYEENLVWIETDGSGNIVAQYVGKFNQFIEVDNASGYPIHFDHVGDAQPETRAGDAWLETTAFSTVTVDTPTTGDNIYEFDIASLEDVFNATGVTITGEQSTAPGGPVTISGSGTGNVDPAGTSTTDGQVVFTGVETTTSDSASLGTLTDGESGSVSVGGNVDPSGESVTFTGSESQSNGDQSLTSVSDGSYPLSNPGNVDPVGGGGSGDPTVTIENLGSQYNEYEGGQTSSSSAFRAMGRASDGDRYGLEAQVNNPPQEIRSIKFGLGDFSEVSAGGEVLLFIDSGGLDGDPAGGTFISNTAISSDDGSTGGSLVFNLDQAYTTNGNQITVELRPRTGWSNGEYFEIDTTFNGSENKMGHFPFGLDDPKQRQRDWVMDLSASRVEEATVSVGGSSVTKTLSPGEPSSETLPFGAGASSIDVSTVNGEDLDVSISKTDITATETPSVTTAGGSASYSGILRGGDSVTRSGPPLSVGSNGITVSTAAGSSVGVDASWTETAATENPSVSISGNTATFAGVLTSGQTATRSINFGAGSDTATVSVTNDCETEITWTDVFETVDPTISLNGTTSQFTGLVPQGEAVTVDVSKSSLTTGTNTLELVSGGPAGVSFSYDEVDTSSTNLTVRLYYSDGSVWKEVP